MALCACPCLTFDFAPRSQQQEHEAEGEEEEESEEEDEEQEEEVGALSRQLAALMRANPALRAATAAEQRTYQRVFDKHGNPQEVLLAFAPNPATVREGKEVRLWQGGKAREGERRVACPWARGCRHAGCGCMWCCRVSASWLWCHFS